MTSRRAFLIGIGSALAAPAIVRAENLMKIVAPKKWEFISVEPMTAGEVFARQSEFVDAYNQRIINTFFYGNSPIDDALKGIRALLTAARLAEIERLDA